MLFNSSRLSTQEVLDKVSLGAYCLQIIVLNSHCLCKFSSSFACASSIFFFFNHLATQSCLMSFFAYIITVFSLCLHNGPAFLRVAVVQSVILY